MEIIFKKGKFFKKLIENCKPLLSTGHLQFTTEGIKLNNLDTNQTAMIIFDIGLDYFTKYKVSENIILPVSFERLSKVFKTYKDTDEMKIKYKKNSDKLSFIFKNIITKKTATHRIGILNEEMMELEVPEMDTYDTEILMTPMTIMNITKDCANFGDTLKIQTIDGGIKEGNKVKFSVEDIEGIAEYEYEENQEDVQEINIEEEVELSFIMSYIVKLSNFSSMAESVKIYISEDTPLLYHYTTPIGEIKLFLSPKIID